jgi:hypothetical protein
VCVCVCVCVCACWMGMEGKLGREGQMSSQGTGSLCCAFCQVMCIKGCVYVYQG